MLSAYCIKSRNNRESSWRHWIGTHCFIAFRWSWICLCDRLWRRLGDSFPISLSFLLQQLTTCLTGSNVQIPLLWDDLFHCIIWIDGVNYRFELFTQIKVNPSKFIRYLRWGNVHRLVKPPLNIQITEPPSILRWIWTHRFQLQLVTAQKLNGSNHWFSRWCRRTDQFTIYRSCLVILWFVIQQLTNPWSIRLMLSGSSESADFVKIQ